MKLKDILSFVCELNGELCRKGDFLLLETLDKIGTRDMVERVTFWCNLAEKYGDREVSEILPLDFYNLRVTIK